MQIGNNLPIFKDLYKNFKLQRNSFEMNQEFLKLTKNKVVVNWST